MSSELLAIFSGLASAASWGAGDFSGGLASRRTSVYVVVIVSQVVGGFLLALAGLLLHERLPTRDDVLWSAAAGTFGAAGLLGLYHGLATGRMCIVAPVTAVASGLLPALIGLFLEGVPGTPQLAGFTLALPAVWLVSQAEGPAGGWHWRELVLPALSGLGLGAFITLISQVSDGAIFWPLVAARITSLIILGTAVLLLRKWERPAKRQLPLIALAGVFDMGGNAFYVLAAQLGRLDVAAILTSLYPASTLLLAWLVLNERLTRPQGVGVALALAAVALIAT
jgi:drug/metabolite transporter (DMT)-like permease